MLGPFSMLKITGKNASPFNVEHSVLSPNFSLVQVQDLFKQYELARSIQLDPRIAKDIYLRASGYPYIRCVYVVQHCMLLSVFF